MPPAPAPPSDIGPHGGTGRAGLTATVHSETLGASPCGSGDRTLRLFSALGLSTGLVTLAASAVPAAAQAQSSWLVEVKGGSAYATVKSRAGGARILLKCNPPGTVRMSLSPPKGWVNAGYDMAVVIDGRRIEVSAEGAGGGVYLSDTEFGVGRSTFEAVKSGRQLVLDGAHVAKVPAAQRSFDLAGAPTALAGVERECPSLK